MATRRRVNSRFGFNANRGDGVRFGRGCDAYRQRAHAGGDREQYAGTDKATVGYADARIDSDSVPRSLPFAFRFPPRRRRRPSRVLQPKSRRFLSDRQHQRRLGVPPATNTPEPTLQISDTPTPVPPSPTAMPAPTATATVQARVTVTPTAIAPTPTATSTVVAVELPVADGDPGVAELTARVYELAIWLAERVEPSSKRDL